MASAEVSMGLSAIATSATVQAINEVVIKIRFIVLDKLVMPLAISGLSTN
jgi:hypothetical protein